MGSKRMSLESKEGAMEEVSTSRESASPGSNKKQKKEKQKDAASNMDNLKPMERKKIRKALDKERHRDTPSKQEVKVKPKEVVADSSLPSDNVLPKFHIDVFKDLASADVSVRVAAVEKMVIELRNVQEVFEKVQDKGSVEVGLALEATKDDGLERCSPSLRYAVRRLIRGASSSRECARQGFTLGFTSLVATIPALRIDSLLRLIINLLEVSSSMKGQDARDCLLGRLFSYGAISRSGRLVRAWSSDHSTPCIKELVYALISLASTKRYLQEPAVAIIVDLVEQLPTEAVTQNLLKIPELEDWFQGAIDPGNPDALFLALSIQEKIHAVEINFGKVLPFPYSPSTLFSSNHLTVLSNCLKESTFCQPRVHSVWPILVNILLPETIVQSEEMFVSNSVRKGKKGRKINSSEEVAKGLKNFCEVVIEGSLILSSHDRKHLALDVVLLLLRRLPASLVSIVLSYKLVHCLMDILSTKESWLYKVAQHFIKELSEWVQNDDVRKVAVVVALLKHSNGKFDSTTRTKTVKSFVESFKTEAGCMLLIKNLVNIFLDDGNPVDEPSDQSQTTDDNSEIGSMEDKELAVTPGSSDVLRISIVDSIPAILRNLSHDHDAKTRVQKEILKFLSVQGIFSASLGTEVTSFELQETFTWPKVSASNAICQMCIEQIQSLLASIQKTEGSSMLADGLEPYDFCSYFISFLITLRSIPSVALYRSLNREDEMAFEKLLEMGSKLSKEEKNHEIDLDTHKLHAMRYLLIQVLLQVLLRPGEFVDAASELIICCKKAFSASMLIGSSEEEETDSDSTPELMDVLVDTLLSLLPQSTASLRSAVEQVFKCFCEDVTHDGLNRMLRIVRKDLKPPRHQAADSEDEDEEDDNDDDIFGLEEELEETGKTGESDEQSEFSETLDESEMDQTENNDSDGELDDDAMFRMDTYLAQILKDKMNQAGGDSTQSQLVLFKLRVLSLLEIYLHENPGKPQVLRVYSNLAQTLVNPHTAEIGDQLAQRIWGILQKKVFKAKEFPKGDSLQLTVLESLLKKNLKLASKPIKKKISSSTSKKKLSALRERQKMISSLARESTFWILKIIDACNFPETDLQGVVKVFDTLLVVYFTSKKLQLKSDFLKEIFRRRPWIGHQLFGSFLDKMASAKSDFCRVESLDLILDILRSLSSSNKLSKHHVKKLSCLVKALVTNMPDKQSRRAEVRKFCNKMFQILSTHGLIKCLLKELEPETQTACESQLGETFINLKKGENN